MRLVSPLALAGLLALVPAALTAQTTLPPLGNWSPRHDTPHRNPMDDPGVAQMLRWLETQGLHYPGLLQYGWPPVARLHASPRPGVDLNENGKVSEEEAAAHAEAVFVAMDSDGDDTLSKDEFIYHGTLLPFAHTGNPMAREPKFEKLDGDDDGRISQAEFIAVARAHYDAARDPITGDVTPWTYRRQAWY